MKATKAKPKTATKAAAKLSHQSKLKAPAPKCPKPRTKATSKPKPTAPKKGEKKRKRPISVSSEDSIMSLEGALLDDVDDDADNDADGLTPDSSRRKTHNVLERKRRNDLKNSYQTLREQVRACAGHQILLGLNFRSVVRRRSTLAPRHGVVGRRGRMYSEARCHPKAVLTRILPDALYPRLRDSFRSSRRTSARRPARS